MRFKPHYRLYACFFLFSSVTGAMFSRLPDIQSNLQVNEAQLGLTLIGAAIGALISLTFSSPLIERLGARRTAFITVLGSTALYAFVPFISYAPLAFLDLVAAGLLAGALEINLNVELARTETLLGRSIMSRAHGFWSLGFFVTALVAAALRQMGVSAQLHLAAMLLVVFIGAIVVISGINNVPARVAHGEDKPPLIAFPTIALLPLCLIGIAAFLIEGAGVDWSAIYMRDAFHAEPFVGGLGLTLFTFFMALARIFIGPVVDHYSPRVVVTILLGLSALGLIAIWLAPFPWVALAGFALLGIGCSAVYPLVVSAAAQRTDRPSAINVAAIGQVTFVIFFLAPPFLGFVAHYFGIRNSYVVCLPLVIAGLAVVSALAKRAQPLPLGETPTEPLSSHG
jgi:MFS family permease